jgi:hypothetical protein
MMHRARRSPRQHAAPYDTVFRRERDKPAGLHRMLQDHGQQIQRLHERVGLELQVRSEAGERSNATLTADELRQIAWQVLDEAAFKPSDKDADPLARRWAAWSALLGDGRLDPGHSPACDLVTVS